MLHTTRSECPPHTYMASEFAEKVRPLLENHSTNSTTIHRYGKIVSTGVGVIIVVARIRFGTLFHGHSPRDPFTRIQFREVLLAIPSSGPPPTSCPFRCSFLLLVQSHWATNSSSAQQIKSSSPRTTVHPQWISNASSRSSIVWTGMHLLLSTWLAICRHTSRRGITDGCGVLRLRSPSSSSSASARITCVRLS